MRALTIRVNDVIGVAGFVRQGSRVDVIVTIRAMTEAITRPVVSNVQVLAAGANIDPEAARSGQATQVAVVTLLVTPEDAERITLAQSQGQIMLALRNPLDVMPVETRGVRMGARAFFSVSTARRPSMCRSRTFSGPDRASFRTIRCRSRSEQTARCFAVLRCRFGSVPRSWCAGVRAPREPRSWDPSRSPSKVSTFTLVTARPPSPRVSRRRIFA